MIFDIENSLLMSNFGSFWTPPHNTNTQNSKFRLGMLILRQKSVQVLCLPFENSTIRITIL